MIEGACKPQGVEQHLADTRNLYETANALSASTFCSEREREVQEDGVARHPVLAAGNRLPPKMLGPTPDAVPATVGRAADTWPLESPKVAASPLSQITAGSGIREVESPAVARFAYDIRARGAITTLTRGGLFLVGMLILACALAIGSPGWPQDAGRAVGSAREVAGQNVLVLSSSFSSLPANRAVISALLRTLQPGGAPEPAIFTEFLDAVRFPGPRHEANNVAHLRERYAGMSFDVVVVLGQPAIDLMRAFGDELAPGVPVVYASAPEAGIGELPPNFVGFGSRFDVGETVRLALALQPEARSLVVIGGAAEIDRRWEASARRELTELGGRLALEFLVGLPMEDLRAAVGRVPRDSIILYLTQVQDGTGRFFVPREVAAELSAVAGAPMYGVYDTYLGHGIVGGYLDTFEATGAKVGEIVRDLLDGKRPADIDPSRSPTYIVDWRELDRWDLDPGRLPPGTEIRYRPPSIWEQHRDLVLVALAALVLQAAMIAALLLERRSGQRAARSLRLSEERYRNVVETQSELICRYRPDTTLTFVNDAYCRSFGKARAALMGVRFIDLVPESARAAVFERVRSLAERPGGSLIDEHAVVRPDGSHGWQQWTDRAVLGTDGRVVEIQGVGRDLTELREAEEEARQRREQVTHLTRVAVLGELSGTLAHELNQPLTAILSDAQAARRLLARDPPTVSDVRAILDDIVAANKRASAVIARLRALLRKEDTQLRPIDLNQIVADTLELLGAELAARQVTVVTEFAASLPPILGDRVQVQQVLLNLVFNGREAMADRVPEERRLTIGTRVGHEGVDVTVSDRGTGIDAVPIDTIFAPFVTSKTSGLGLGLAICRTIIDAHGGRIWARNDPGQGATVGFTLPVATEAAHG